MLCRFVLVFSQILTVTMIRFRSCLVLTVFALACGRKVDVQPPPPPRPEPVPVAAAGVIGVLLPQTGAASLSQYGRLVLEGVRLAADEHRAAGGRVELAILDDAGDASRDAELLGQLEQQGAAAIIGPLLSEGIIRAAANRRDTTLVLVSPTASEDPVAHNAFSLNTSDTNGPVALAAYARASGWTRVALLHPRTGEYAGHAQSFADAARAAGIRVVTDVAYDSGTTTFAPQVRTLIAATPEAVYISASERDIRQLAPQLEYYGLTRRPIRILGNEAWTSDEVLRLVDAKHINGVVASTPLNKASASAGWRDFVALYEKTHRRTLDNPYPALGYDAARLLLHALESGRRPRDVARGLQSARELRGATGILSVQGGRIVRRPFIVRIQDRQLIDVEPNR
jgi:branched-chain amino acid transport system substrate-binding protein